MIQITETLDFFPDFHTELGYEPERSLFFDIETTGLSPDSSVVFLIGMLTYLPASSRWQVRQLLAESSDEEPLLLAAFLSLAAGYDTLLHFNGNTFDLPFLKKKAAAHSLSHTLDSCISLDLYQRFRPIGKLLQLPQMTQQSFERALGWQRKDRLTGKQMTALFRSFETAQEPAVRDLLLLHNHDDLTGMTRLLQLAAYPLLLEGQFGKIEQAEYDSDKAPDPLLQITFSLAAALPVPLVIERPPYRLSAADVKAKLTVRVFCGTLCHFFPDYRNYYYLPLEDQAIHRSVAAFIDREYRIPAKASNCYIKRNSVFLPQPEPLFSPVFRRSYKDPKLYFEYTETLSLPDYVQAVLSSFSRT